MHVIQYNTNEILHVQNILRTLDVQNCKTIANWLSDHINMLEIDDALFKINIQQLRLSARTYNVLRNNRIDTIGQLIQRASDWNNIKMLKGVGKKVANELHQKISQIQQRKFQDLNTMKVCSPFP
jgi:DNA-directed RNA polymerase alpha subunit